MTRTVTIWENEMTDQIDDQVNEFIQNNFKGYEVKQLSGLSYRDPMEIIESVRDSYAIIMQPNLIVASQVQDLARLISHPIHVGKNGAQHTYDVQRFIFISTLPFETLKEIKDALKNVKDQVNESCLMKILKNCSVEFMTYDNSIHYELKSEGNFDTQIIRYK